MSRLSRCIKERLDEVTMQIAFLEKRLLNAPEGRLRVSNCRGFARFYRITEAGEVSGEYLSVANKEIIRKLAQKDYDSKVLSMLQKEYKLLTKINIYYSKSASSGEEFFYGPEESIPAGMVEARRKEIQPIVLDQESYIEEWKGQEYERKGFSDGTPEYRTSRGIRVRSKTEWMIAELLEKKGVPFYYEKPLYLKGSGTVHPDFTVLNVKKRKTMYWEHLGMMGDEQYSRHALKKIEYYIMNDIFPGIELILTHETASDPVRPQILEKTIETYLLS